MQAFPVATLGDRLGLDRFGQPRVLAAGPGLLFEFEVFGAQIDDIIDQIETLPM